MRRSRHILSKQSPAYRRRVIVKPSSTVYKKPETINTSRKEGECIICGKEIMAGKRCIDCFTAKRNNEKMDETERRERQEALKQLSCTKQYVKTAALPNGADINWDGTHYGGTASTVKSIIYTADSTAGTVTANYRMNIDDGV